MTGGSRAEEGDLKCGFFVRPTLFDEVQSSMRIAQWGRVPLTKIIEVVRPPPHAK
jgi:hypothetical protein